MPHPKMVVVIDDELDNVDTAVTVLRSAGHAALGATEGRAGVKLVIDSAANTVVLDYLMPEMSGAEVGKILRADPATKDVKILMYSGSLEETIRASFQHYDAYLMKPALGNELLHAVEAL